MITHGVEVQWQRLDPVGLAPPARAFSSITACGNRYLAVVGGMSSTKPAALLGDLWVYDTCTYAWSELLPVTTAGERSAALLSRAHHEAFFVQEKLFVIGGQVPTSGAVARLQCASSVLVIEHLFVKSQNGGRVLNLHPVVREVDCSNTPGVMSHGKSQVVLFPRADGASGPAVEEVLVTYGGHDGKLLRDGVAFFSFSQEEWLRPDKSAASPFLFPVVDAKQRIGLDIECPHCGASGNCCAHQSAACNSYGIARKRLSALAEPTVGMGGSLPPRCGHSLSLVSPVDDDESESVALCADLVIFGGEVGMCVSNAVFGVSLRRGEGGSIRATWRELVPGGSEYCKRRGLLQRPQVEPPATSRHQQQRDDDRCHDRYDEGPQHLVRISESPRRSGSLQGYSDQTPDRRAPLSLGLSLQVDQIPHTAFHCAWPAGSNGLVVYGGLNGAAGTYNEQLYFLDTVRTSWFAVHCAHTSPGCRVGAAEATLEAPGEVCTRCGAPSSERHFMFGGEDKLEQCTNDLFVFQLHAFGCHDQTVSPIGRAAPELTPPPRRVPRSAAGVSSGTPGSRSVMKDAMQLPLKMIAAMLLLRHGGAPQPPTAQLE